MLLSDMKFRMTLFDMIERLPCVLFFPMCFLVLRQKTEANSSFAISIIYVEKTLSHFLQEKSVID